MQEEERRMDYGGRGMRYEGIGMRDGRRGLEVRDEKERGWDGERGRRTRGDRKKDDGWRK